MFIGPTPGHAAHHRQRVLSGCTTVLTGLRLTDLEFRVLTAFPMDRQHHVPHSIVYVNDDIGDECPQQLLAHAHGHIRRFPGSQKVVGQVREGAWIDFYCRRTVGRLAFL